jgi:1-acyl-sn-glycerol-3-phosphate acyltransferase
VRASSGRRRPSPGGRANARDSLIEAVAHVGIRTFCRAAVARRLDPRVEGLTEIPRRGPVLIACRHFHHFYDAELLLTAVPRPIHFLVALDWVHGPRERRLMEWACRTARWPALLRVEQLGDQDSTARAYGVAEAGRYLRRAVGDSLRLLREGRILVVFPEAYPTVDPEGSPKRDPGAILPFRPGFVRLVALAERSGVGRIPIIPAGLSYGTGQRLPVVLRFGSAVFLEHADRASVARLVEGRVRELSGAMPVPG